MNKCSWILRLSFAFSSETAQAANTSTNVLVNILEGSILSITRTTSPVNVSGKHKRPGEVIQGLELAGDRELIFQ